MTLQIRFIADLLALETSLALRPSPVTDAEASALLADLLGRHGLTAVEARLLMIVMHRLADAARAAGLQ